MNNWYKTHSLFGRSIHVDHKRAVNGSLDFNTGLQPSKNIFVCLRPWHTSDIFVFDAVHIHLLTY